MSEPAMHTLESFDALAGDEERNAAITRALGQQVYHTWYCPACGVWLVWSEVTHDERHDEREGGCGHPVVPGAWKPYYTGGDADPFANWGLLAEVARALTRGRTATHMHNDAWEVALELIVTTRGCTPHRAACHALVADGLVPREEKQ